MSHPSSRVIGILGPSFCGSTILGLCLDGLPGVAFVGETHWLLDDPTSTLRRLPCRECYPDPCPRFTPELIARLHAAQAEGRWWPAMAADIGCDVLVTSDKVPSSYDRLGLPDVLLSPRKHPCAHVRSAIRYLHEDHITDETIEAAIGWLHEHTMMGLYWASERDLPVVPVDIAAFAREPAVELHNLCTRLDLGDFVQGFAATAADPTNSEHHHVGGNFSLRDRRAGTAHRSAYFGTAVRPDDQWRTELTPAQINRITTDPRVRALEEAWS